MSKKNKHQHKSGNEKKEEFNEAVSVISSEIIESKDNGIEAINNNISNEEPLNINEEKNVVNKSENEAIIDSDNSIEVIDDLNDSALNDLDESHVSKDFLEAVKEHQEDFEKSITEGFETKEISNNENTNGKDVSESEEIIAEPTSDNENADINDNVENQQDKEIDNMISESEEVIVELTSDDKNADINDNVENQQDEEINNMIGESEEVIVEPTSNNGKIEKEDANENITKAEENKHKKKKTLEYEHLVDLLKNKDNLTEEQVAIAIENDLKNCNPTELLKTFKQSLFKDNLYCLSKFLYYNYSYTGKSTSPITIDEITNDILASSICISNYYVVIMGIRNKQHKIINKAIANIKEVNKKSVCIELSHIFVKNNIVTITEGKISSKVFKKIEKTFIKNEKKMDPIEYDFTIRLLFDSYGNTFNNGYSHSYQTYKKYNKKIEDETKVYCLSVIAKNNLLHGDFSNAKKIYENILNISNDDFDAKINLILVKHKCVTFEELFAKKKLANIKEFKALIKKADDEDNETLKKQIEEFSNKEKEYRRKGLDAKLSVIRKAVFVFAIVGFIVFVSLAFSINYLDGRLWALACGVMMPVSSLITADIKGNLKSIIIKGVIALILCILVFVLIK